MFAREEERGRAPGAVRGGIARDRRSVLFGGARRRRVLAALTTLTVVSLAVTLIVVRPALPDDGAPTARIGPAPPRPARGARPAGPAPPPPPRRAAGPAPAVHSPPIDWKVSRPIGVPWH